MTLELVAWILIAAGLVLTGVLLGGGIAISAHRRGIAETVASLSTEPCPHCGAVTPIELRANVAVSPEGTAS